MIRFYDVRVEAMREATQADWDLLWSRAWANADKGKAMDDVMATVLHMLDELAHAQLASNSPTDHLVAIQRDLDALRAQYSQIHDVVHLPVSEVPTAASQRYHVTEPAPAREA